MTDYTELKRLAEAFPVDLDWDGNTEPFFNGPSGESLGGGATGFYCVYGKPFRLEGEDYDYDGPTYVEACPADFAKFMVAAREGILALIAENERLAKTADCWGRLNIQNKALSDSFRAERDQLKAEVAQLQEENENLRTCSSAVNASVALENEALRKDSESYRLLSFCHGQGTLELVRSHHELCAEIRRLKILAGEPVPPTPEEFVGPRSEGPTARIRRQLAAMGKGEQS